MDKNSIFVVMPFRKELDNVYFAIQTIGKDLNCEVIRVDELQTEMFQTLWDSEKK